MSLEAYFQATSNERVLRRLKSAVVDFLSDLVKTLDPPVLVQLERGQLGKLSRAETEQLKIRVGIRWHILDVAGDAKENKMARKET